tara:strand:+ start:11187 stop:11363 length:177 start_codon:yes stop_codon:yes gene_type:complete
MVAVLTTAQLNEFVEKVDILESQGYKMSYTIDKVSTDKYKVEVDGEHDLEHLDSLVAS